MKKPKVFYGYWIVGAAYYAFPLFYKPLEVEFGWSRGTVSVAFTIYYAIQGVAAPLIGRLVDRYGAKKFIALGALITGLGFIWLTSIQDLWSFYGGYAVVGVGMAAMGPVPTPQLA